MKKVLCLILASALSFSCLMIRAFADTEVTKDGMTAHVSDVFTVFTSENIDSKAGQAEALSEDFERLKQKLNSDYLFYAVTENLGWTVFMTSAVTEVSSNILNLAEFSDEQLAEQALIGNISEQTSELKQIRKGAALFYRLTFQKDAQKGNSDSRIIYLTVINGRIYTLTLIEKSEQLSQNAADTAEYIFNSLEYTVETEKQRVAEKKRSAVNWMIIVCVPLAAVGVFFIVRSIKRDFDAAKQEEDLQRNIRKKPRR